MSYLTRQEFLKEDVPRIQAEQRQGNCGEPGPWSTVCTLPSWHKWSHYDGSDDSSWQDDWHDWAPDEDDDDGR